MLILQNHRHEALAKEARLALMDAMRVRAEWKKER